MYGCVSGIQTVMFKLNVIRKYSFVRVIKHRMLCFCFFVFIVLCAEYLLCALSKKIYIAEMVCIPEFDAEMLL